MVDVTALTKLARIEVSDAEKAELETQLSGVISLVDELKSMNVDFKMASAPAHRNIFREDTDPRPRKGETETLLNAAPAQEKGYLAVKQVLSRKK